MKYFILFVFLFATHCFSSSAQQNIVLQAVAGEMNCVATVPGLDGQAFILGLPETIASTEGMILNFPDVSIQWSGPDRNGVLSHTWTSQNKIEYSLRMTPSIDYVDVEMTVKNISASNWTNVFSFNCLNPAAADRFKDWGLKRTYMSKNGRPFRMDSTKRVNDGPTKTVQFYLHENYHFVSPFVSSFKATSPDRTDDSYLVTLSDDFKSYIAATSPACSFLFDNLDRCCIHSAASFGDIPIGTEKKTTCRFYFAKGGLQDFLARFNAEVKQVKESKPRVLMCYGSPWVLSDTTQWSEVYKKLDLFKFYVDGIDPARIGKDQVKGFLAVLLKQNIKIAIELGGLVDWHADKKDRSAEYSFRDEYAKLKPLIGLIKEIDPSRNIDMLDMDGPIRRMLYPNNVKADFHTLSSAVTQLLQVVKMYQDSIPGIEINLLTNFPNWAWGATPAYFAISGDKDGYGKYEAVLDSVKVRSDQTGIRFSGLTVDNPYDYATGAAQTNQPALIAGVDWMQRLVELDRKAKTMGLKLNMIFNTNGGRTSMGYSDQTLSFIDLYHGKVGKPDGYWIQSWYQLPDKWLPETEAYTMTNLTREALKKVEQNTKSKALLEPEDGRVYHGVQTMTFEGSGDPLAGYLGALNDPTIQPAVRGLFFSIPGTRGADKSLKELGGFFAASDSIGFIPELSLFFVSTVATDSVIAVSNQYDWILDSIVTLSKNYGRKMFLRIGGEFNGAGEGWNGGGYHPHLYVAMFKKIVDKFAARGFRDSIAVIWCYEPDAANNFDSTDANGPLWYPGDNYADWFGLDVFDAAHFDQSLPDYVRGVITRKGKAERFLSMARLKGKPVYMSETSAKGINISSDSTDSASDWNNWFAKFWEFIGAHKEIKGFGYIDANWPAGAYPNWGDARIQNSPYVTGWYKAEMKNPKYIHLPTSGPTAVDAPDKGITPATFILSGNHPNPFSSATRITWRSSLSGQTTVTVFDVFGREVAKLMDEAKPAGAYEVRFNAEALRPGMYMYRIAIGAHAVSGKMTLIK
jgi:hypothetical protein